MIKGSIATNEATLLDTQRFPPTWFTRMEESDDALFYARPRKVVHLDDDAIAALRDFYSRHLEGGWQLLDLMSSWRSHLPKLMRLSTVGLGMNAEEMYDNPQLDDYVVHDLNRTATLPFADQQFDAALCAVSVQYLTQPVQLFAEVGRVLKRGAPFIVSISNRTFPTKVVSVWRASNDQQHIQLVAGYFQASGRFDTIQAEDHSPHPYQGDPLFIIWGYAR
ncbi:MAG: methyltransferase domain-containing protein [Ardenticatenales bacterium]|nr:methyltransferase domain-containing protein [Ardenticatenales bacterium]